jgi:plasmid stability protein
MPALHIRNVPEDTVAILKRRAARRGHSLEAELRGVLDDAAASGTRHERGSILDRIVTVSTGRTEPISRDEIYSDDDPDGR